MRYLLFLLLAVPAFAQSSFKGWELYSWNREGHWHYSLLPGTNRYKNWSEIEAAGMGDVENLKRSLNRLDEGESVFWFHFYEGPPGQLSYPPDEVQRQLTEVCAQRGLKLARPR
jgi:hypothetical protein